MISHGSSQDVTVWGDGSVGVSQLRVGLISGRVGFQSGIRHVRAPAMASGASGYNTAVPSKNLDGGRIKTNPGQPIAAALALAAVTLRPVSRLRV
jgi:hypothetical protein